MSGATGQRALVLEDDRASREALAQLLGARGYQVTECDTLAAAREALDAAGVPQLAILDLGLPDGDGMTLVADIRDREGSCATVVLTGDTRLDRAVEAMRLGAADFLSKPLQPDALALTLARVERLVADEAERRALRKKLARRGEYQGIIGGAPVMQELYGLIERFGGSDLSVMVRGESGSGKELVANALHTVSRRRSRPFVAINCGAIAPTLAESEFFGHVRGAFTGAGTARQGAFQRANGGTLFLDEVTEMGLDLQASLLRVLEEGQVKPVGSDRATPVDVRIVSATNRDPHGAIAEGKLREDLFFRLNVLPLDIPPLRARLADVGLLTRHFVGELAARDQRRPSEVTGAALAALEQRPWPGNVRELKNVVARAYVLAGDGPIDLSHVGDSGGGGEAATAATAGHGVAGGVVIPEDATLADAERLLVVAQLNRQGWHRERTAAALGIGTKTLFTKIKAWGLTPPE